MDQRKLRALALIRRFNFERCNRHESVAEHAHFVALLVMDATRAMGWPPAEVAMAVLVATLHDAEEAATGDVPFLVKRSLPPPAVEALEARAWSELGIDCVSAPGIGRLVEFCDIMELLMYLSEERRSGNGHLDRIGMETAARLVNHALWPQLRGWACGVLEMEESELDAFSGVSFGGLKH